MQRDELNMRIRERKVQGRHGGNRPPRVIVHVPEWLSQFTVLSRGLRYVLAGVAFVACAGTILYISDVLPEPSENIYHYSGATTQQVSSTNNHFTGSSIKFATLPLQLSNLAELNLDVTPQDVPFFVHLPHSGAPVVKRIMGECAGLVEALDTGGQVASEMDMEVTQVKDIGQVIDLHNHYKAGMMDEIACNTIKQNTANAVVSPSPYSAACIFSAQRRGRMFTMFRDPVDRIHGYFEELRNSPDFENVNMTFREYAEKLDDRPEFNYVTKLLVNKLDKKSKDLTERDLMTAKAILSRKVLVGLLSEKEKSLNRFQKYFKWTYNADSDFCRNTLVFKSSEHKPYRKLGPKESTYNLLQQKNSYDISLYEYSKILFKEQTSLFEGM